MYPYSHLFRRDVHMPAPIYIPHLFTVWREWGTSKPQWRGSGQIFVGNLSMDEELVIWKYRMWAEIRGSEVLLLVQKHAQKLPYLCLHLCIPKWEPIDFLYVKTNMSLFIDAWLNCVGECMHVPNAVVGSSFFSLFSFQLKYFWCFIYFISFLYLLEQIGRRRKMN